MATILNWIVKGLMQWLHGLFWEIGEFIMNSLINVFSMDMAYFKTAVPISETILNIMFGVGWALLLGNLVFQAAKAMMTGIGFEGEDPRTLGIRTMVFAFLLVASRQVCEIGLSLGATVVDLLQIPGSVILPSWTDNMFSIDASWLLVMIMGIILIFQLVKFFFEVGERYVIVGILTILSPLALFFRSKLWLTIVFTFLLGMMFYPAASVATLGSTVITLLISLIAGAIGAVAIGAVSGLVLRKRDLA